MTKVMDTLRDFIDSAERSRKYPTNTAVALKNALKLFEAELNEEEALSLDTFKDHLDQIYHSVFEKNKNRMSVGSLATYKARVNRVLGDYEKYGSDPTKFATWSPAVKTRAPRRKLDESAQHPSGRDISMSFSNNEQYAPARTLPSGIMVIFPKTMDAQVSFGSFGEELKRLDGKGLNLAGDISGGEKTEDSN